MTLIVVHHYYLTESGIEDGNKFGSASSSVSVIQRLDVSTKPL